MFSFKQQECSLRGAATQAPSRAPDSALVKFFKLWSCSESTVKPETKSKNSCEKCSRHFPPAISSAGTTLGARQQVRSTATSVAESRFTWVLNGTAGQHGSHFQQHLHLHGQSLHQQGHSTQHREHRAKRLGAESASCSVPPGHANYTLDSSRGGYIYSKNYS